MQHQQIPIHVKTSQAANLPVFLTYCPTLKMEAPAPLKFWYLSTRLHEAMSKQTVELILAAERTSNFELLLMCIGVSPHQCTLQIPCTNPYKLKF
jgi:hypothetical protein